MRGILEDTFVQRVMTLTTLTDHLSLN